MFEKKQFEQYYKSQVFFRFDESAPKNEITESDHTEIKTVPEYIYLGVKLNWITSSMSLINKTPAQMFRLCGILKVLQRKLTVRQYLKFFSFYVKLDSCSVLI